MPDKRLDDNGLEKTLLNLKDIFIPLANNAGAHNSIYRGKFLGNSVTAEQWAAIADGSFADLYVGDYWTIGSQDWVICDFDYYIRCGNANITQHHVVVMPRTGMTIPAGTPLYGTSQTLTLLSGESSTAFMWNPTSTTNGGYKYSRMRQIVMKAANTIVIGHFGSNHIKAIDELYPDPSSASDSGVAVNWAWFDQAQTNIKAQSLCDLCNETMVYGQQVWGRGSAYTNVGYEVGMDKFQLSIFALDRSFANIYTYWWLRSVTSATGATLVDFVGYPAVVTASYVLAVRPRFLLVG